MKLLNRLYVVTTSDKIALMRWPERPGMEMDDIANAIMNVECGIASVPYNQVGLPGRFFSILWSREIVVERLSARNAFVQPLAWGIGQLFVSTGSSVITYNLNSKGQDYTLWTAEDKWIDSLVAMDYKVIALALDRVDGKFVVGGELVMLSSTGEVLWRSRPTFMDDDGFIGVSLWEGKLVGETWSSRSVTLDPKTGQIIQSSFTK